MREQILQLLILFISIFSRILYWAIFIYIVMSWVSRKKTPFTDFLKKVVDPIVKPFRFARLGMLDFSPLVALLAIEFGSSWLIQFIAQYLAV